ncbi:MAG: CD1871A family CXXC motif-containing protein [Aminipila sp.]
MSNKIISGQKRRTTIGAVVLILGLIFIMIGVSNGESKVVLQKAIMICLECIGIG